MHKEETVTKKRCTESSCRREFTVFERPAVCPHCGKVYPRLGEQTGVYLVRADRNTRATVAAVKAYRASYCSDIRTAVNRVRDTKTPFCFKTRSEAEKFIAVMRNAGMKMHLVR